jgi:hypothetical protein
MTDVDAPCRVAGHQREIDPKHARDIKKYLEQSDNRFIPEVILSVRYEVAPIIIDTKTVGIRTTAHDGPIIMTRRIDGNHRLKLAEELQEDMTIPRKYLAPFCMVLLGPPENDADDYAESLIFHTINSTALPLDSEHGLRLLLGQDPAYAMTADNEFAYSPELHLTRLLSDRLQRLPVPARERFGERPLTALRDSARNLITIDSTITDNRPEITTFADNLFAGLSDISTHLTIDHPSLCQTYGFFELAARIWREAPEGDHETKVRWAVDYLDRLGRWLGSAGITSLLNPISPAQQLLETFKASQQRMPKRVFLARWYPQVDAPKGAYGKAVLRLQQLRETMDAIEREHGVRLELIDMGTEEGGSFPIHQRMYEAISSSDIIICDLTGHRPNVYVEAGYALKHHEKNRLIFLFEPINKRDKVPFDLSTFKYVQINQAAEIPNKIKAEIIAILREAGAPL